MSNFQITRRNMLLGTAGLSAASLFSGTALALAGPSPVTETRYGKVRGDEIVGDNGNSTLAFKGIPYGADTSGKHRFMPPRNPESWAGVKDCTAYGFSAPQMSVVLPGAPKPGSDAEKKLLPFPMGERASQPESEDCLRLNVWTPSTKGKRAVMFWMHGGGFSNGSGSALWYEGTNLAAKQDVVVVTVNHRLNVLGYCDLSAYGEAYADSGNVGMLDCAHALKWVQENIEAFGGDPERVMIFGESGGGRKTSMMMRFSPAQGLFHRAVVQSGSSLRLDTPDISREKTKRLLQELGIAPKDISKLHGVSLADMRKAGETVFGELGQWQPTANGLSLPSQPFSPDAPAVSAHIPMMIGTNRTEISLFMARNPMMDHLKLEHMPKFMQSMGFKGQEVTVAQQYREAFPDKSIAELIYMIGTDRGYFLDSTLQAERKAALGKAPAYLYSFYRDTPIQGGRYFSPHAQEIPFVFDTLKHSTGLIGERTQAAQALADQMSTTWATFAKSGIPSAPSLEQWHPYNAEERPTMIFDEGSSRIENDPRSWQRKLMLSFGSQQEA